MSKTLKPPPPRVVAAAGVGVVAAVDVVAVDVVRVEVVAVVLVVLVVGQRPSPGWQSGTSAWLGHGLPPLVVFRVTTMLRNTPSSHSTVHSLKSYAQSSILVVVVVVVVLVVVAVVVVAVVRVVVRVVVLVVGQRPSPGWQSGTSVPSGHALPPLPGGRVIVIVRFGPASHCAVQMLYS